MATLIAIAVAGVAAANAKGSASEASRRARAGAALAIDHKAYVEEAGEIRLVLRNTSDLTVTAFAVTLVSTDGLGGADIVTSGADFFPAEGLAPGAAHELLIRVPEHHDHSSRYAARALRIDHEVFSDNSSVGNPSAIRQVFESRVAYLEELEDTLAALREGGSAKPAQSLIEGRVARAGVAREALASPGERGRQRDTQRLSAAVSVGRYLEQGMERIERGVTPEGVVEELKTILEGELWSAYKNVRSADLGRRSER